MQEKDLNITEIRGAHANISDLQVYGDGDTFALLCKASSQEQGWMKSTKVCNVPGGCIVQVTTQQRNPDGSYAVAEAVCFVPGVMIDKDAEPRQLVPMDMLGRGCHKCKHGEADDGHSVHCAHPDRAGALWDILESQGHPYWEPKPR